MRADPRFLTILERGFGEEVIRHDVIRSSGRQYSRRVVPEVRGPVRCVFRVMRPDAKYMKRVVGCTLPIVAAHGSRRAGIRATRIEGNRRRCYNRWRSTRLQSLVRSFVPPQLRLKRTIPAARTQRLWKRGQVAQVVERSPEKAGVGGSTPSLATIIPKNLGAFAHFLQPKVQPKIDHWITSVSR